MSECPSRWVVAFIFSLIHSPGVEKCWVDRIHTGGGRTRSLRTPGRSWHQTCKQCYVWQCLEWSLQYLTAILFLLRSSLPLSHQCQVWWSAFISYNISLETIYLFFVIIPNIAFMSAPDRSWHQQLSRSLSTDPSRGWRGQWAGDGAAKQDRLHYTFTFPAKVFIASLHLKIPVSW